MSFLKSLFFLLSLQYLMMSWPFVGVAETSQINCHSWPFLSVFFFLFPPFAQFFFSLPALLFIQWFITKVSFISWSSSPLPLPLLALLLETLYERCMPLFKCIDCTHRRPLVFCPPGLLKSEKVPEHKQLDISLNRKSLLLLFLVLHQNVFVQDLKILQHTHFEQYTPRVTFLKYIKTDKKNKLQNNCVLWGFFRLKDWRVSLVLLPLTVTERNVILQANVVTDSLSGALYGSSVLLVNPSLCHSRQYMKVDLPYLFLSFTPMLKSFSLCIIPGCAGLFQDLAEKCFKEFWWIISLHCPHFTTINMSQISIKMSKNLQMSSRGTLKIRSPWPPTSKYATSFNNKSIHM